MPVRVRIPTPLRPYAGGRAELAASGATVSAVLEALLDASPGLRPHLLGDDGRLRSFVNLFVNGEDVRTRGGLAAPLADGDELAIVPAIALWPRMRLTVLSEAPRRAQPVARESSAVRKRGPVARSPSRERCDLLNRRWSTAASASSLDRAAGCRACSGLWCAKARSSRPTSSPNRRGFAR